MAQRGLCASLSTRVTQADLWQLRKDPARDNPEVLGERQNLGNPWEPEESGLGDRGTLTRVSGAVNSIGCLISSGNALLSRLAGYANVPLHVLLECYACDCVPIHHSLINNLRCWSPSFRPYFLFELTFTSCLSIIGDRRETGFTFPTWPWGIGH